MINNKKVSVIIPARNEENCIGRLIDEIERSLVDEVVVVDGSSNDNTIEEAGKKGAIVVNQEGTGYGSAVQQGISKSTGDILILMDADGSHDPKYVPDLLSKVEEGYEYVMGSRYAKGARSDDDTLIRWFGNKLFTSLTNIIHGTNVTDSIYTYNAIPREAYNRIGATSEGFEYCTEILVKASKAGLKFAEIPVVERERFAGESKVNALWHGLIILKMILRRFS